MLVKGMLAFSGTDLKPAQRFQIGGIGLQKEIEQSAELFEGFGASIANTAIKLYGNNQTLK